MNLHNQQSSRRTAQKPPKWSANRLTAAGAWWGDVSDRLLAALRRLASENPYVTATDYTTGQIIRGANSTIPERTTIKRELAEIALEGMATAKRPKDRIIEKVEPDIVGSVRWRLAGEEASQ